MHFREARRAKDYEPVISELREYIATVSGERQMRGMTRLADALRRAGREEEAIDVWNDLAAGAEDEGVRDRARWQANALSRKLQTVPGSLAPGFSATMLAGETMTLAQHRGSVVLLEFQPAHMLEAMPEWRVGKELHERFSEQGLIVIGILYAGSHEQAELAAVRAGIEYPVVFDDAADESASLLWLYGVNSYSFNVLIDRDGKIAAIDRSYPPREVTRAVERLLEGEGGAE